MCNSSEIQKTDVISITSTTRADLRNMWTLKKNKDHLQCWSSLRNIASKSAKQTAYVT